MKWMLTLLQRPLAPQRDEVPVFALCVKVVAHRPVYKFGRLTLLTTDREMILALARDWPRARKYVGELEAIIAGCT